jgi:UDP-N-acetylglucosamine 3-dehydrogenase
MKNGKQIHVGVLGAGTMGRIHAESIKNSGVALVAAVFACDEGSHELASAVGAPAVDDAREIFNDADIDAVVIACPTDAHAEYLRLAHASGKHVFCEKPLVRTLEEVDEVEKLYRKYPKVVAVGHVLRFAPAYLQMRDAAINTLGTIGTIRFGRCAAFPRGRDGWFASYKRSGGVILDLMLHDFDALRFCFGEIDRVYTMRSAGTADLHRDYAITVARMTSGAIAHLEGSWAEAPGVFYYYYEVAGSNGLIEYDSRVEPSLTLQSKAETEGGQPGVIVPQSPTVVSPYELEMADFLHCIATGGKPVVSLQDGIASLRVAHAAMQSAQEDRPIQVKV